jgi:hypothetical protein
MRLSLLIVAILATLAVVLEFGLRRSQDQKLKDRLLKFYVVVKDGDWTALYRYPSAVLFRGMARILGLHPLGVRYVVVTIIISVSMTPRWLSKSRAVTEVFKRIGGSGPSANHLIRAH